MIENQVIRINGILFKYMTEDTDTSHMRILQLTEQRVGMLPNYDTYHEVGMGRKINVNEFLE